MRELPQGRYAVRPVNGSVAYDERRDNVKPPLSFEADLVKWVLSLAGILILLPKVYQRFWACAMTSTAAQIAGNRRFG